MGYESKVYICERHEHWKVPYNECICAVEMCKVGYDYNWKKLFDKELTGGFFGMETNEEITEDRYGEALMYTSVDKVLMWLENVMEVEHYRRFTILYNMLKSFDSDEWNNLIVVHYGH